MVVLQQAVKLARRREGWLFLLEGTAGLTNTAVLAFVGRPSLAFWSDTGTQQGLSVRVFTGQIRMSTKSASLALIIRERHERRCGAGAASLAGATYRGAERERRGEGVLFELYETSSGHD